MSHQPTQFETFKTAAAEQVDKVSNTLSATDKRDGYDENKDANNFTRDDYGNVVKKGDLKDRLNDAARGDKGEGEVAEPGLVEKVMNYIPGMSSEKTKEENEMGMERGGNGGPPTRPEHDVQVEQFLRGQYHSRSGDGMPNPDGK